MISKNDLPLVFQQGGKVRTENIITSKKQWPKRESLIPGHKNVVNTPLVNTEKVYLPLQHMKLTHKKFRPGNDQVALHSCIWKISLPGEVMPKSKKGYLLGRKYDS